MLGVVGSVHTIAALVKAVVGIAVVGVDDDVGAPVLEADGGVDDEALGAADAQVRVEEHMGAGRLGLLGLLREAAVDLPVNVAALLVGLALGLALGLFLAAQPRPRGVRLLFLWRRP